MSGIGAINGSSSIWSLAASGISAIRAAAAITDSSQEAPTKRDVPEERETVDSATITKRMSDGAMVVLTLHGDNVVTSHTYSRTGKNLTLATNYSPGEQREIRHYQNNMDSVLAGSFINITA
ncbi:hypothetical protein FZ041_13345 [Selenomonas caprae]|uniref:Uncharacterized protein n=1 Tax=Selenomonas caprae TaxID=2606905 RepID=A0A5D6WIV3_9FIRM|nr:hypothetical protein [Selenomonas caprae]TYZ26828.1 hypothetical protein FZ041_13345 [Selenomonas caprae]